MAGVEDERGGIAALGLVGRRALGHRPARWFLASALLVIACGGSSRDTGSAHGGGGGVAGGGAGTAGATGGGDCAPLEAGFRDSCSSDAPSDCCTPASPPVMTVLEGDEPLAPDWSCIGVAGTAAAGGAAGSSGSSGAGGTGTGGAAGASERNVFEITDMWTNGTQLVPDAGFELYTGIHIIDRIPWFTGTTKGADTPAAPELEDGQAHFPHPSEPVLSYLVPEDGMTIGKGMAGYGLPVPPPPGIVSAVGIPPQVTLDMPPYWWSVPDHLAYVLVPVVDCRGRDVGGALLQLIDLATGEPVPFGRCESEFRATYFDDRFPNSACNHTDPRRSVIEIMAPQNATGSQRGHPYELQLLGRLRESDAKPVVFARRRVDLVSDIVNLHVVRPNVMQ